MSFSEKPVSFKVMRYTRMKLWHQAPFIRLLLPFIAGILVQWYLQMPLPLLLAIGCVLIFSTAAYRYISLKQRFFLGYINGILLNAALAVSGALVVWFNDVRNDALWLGNVYTAGDALLLTLEEPLVEKTASYKAVAKVHGLYIKKTYKPAKGTVILYFKKEELTNELFYGTQIIIKKPLQVIANSGNPGAFDYRRYSLFNGITHQAFLSSNEFFILPNRNATVYKNILFKSRAAVVAILKKYIKGEKEQGLAEALLIGYKDDLDKKLVEAYSNTGVVHVIAISGLHLGIIYWILLWITKPLKSRRSTWLRLIIILAGLWSFSLLAGAQPSVLRSAVMFSAIAISIALNRQSSIYNTLALSAFCLLCWNPYWLWDVGFQLSYLAVLSIILFFRPIYNWCFFPNKSLDFVWKLMAVSLAAQILTLPISVYHFHQFPFLFLLANLVAVPLSSLILIGEIILCILSFIHPIAHIWGFLLTCLIQVMNNLVERLDTIPFGVWEGLSISPFQAVLLYVIIASAGWWLLEKERQAAMVMLCCLAVFMLLRSLSFISAIKQQKLIVYNVPRHQAIDILYGRNYRFIGDDVLTKDDFLRNFHIQPSRVMHRIEEDTSMYTTKSISLNKKNVLVIDTSVVLQHHFIKPVIDVLVLSKNPKIYIAKLASAAVIKQVVIDGSVPAWKATRWKHDCDSLGIPFYNVAVLGAFVMDF